MGRCNGLERRVCAELLPEVIEASSRFQGNADAGADTRLEIRRTDGRHELLRSSETYDLITLEPPPPSAAGVANLYSTEFYELAGARLNPQGLLAQWLPLPTQNDHETRSLVRSFVDVFPHATLWTTELHEMLLIGSQDPLELDMSTIQRRFEQPGVQTCLSEVGVPSPAALLATYVCGRSELERYAADALPVTDNRPRIEYGPWTLPGEFQHTLRNLMAIRSVPNVMNADEGSLAELSERRSTLSQFYSATLASYEGDRESWRTAMETVLRAEPDNPYFRWFAPDDR